MFSFTAAGERVFYARRVRAENRSGQIAAETKAKGRDDYGENLSELLMLTIYLTLRRDFN
jgi:hypothetical protein